MAYLEDADDTRNTPAVPLIRALQARGAGVVAHDPYVTEHEWGLAWDGAAPVALVRDLDAALAGADCAVLVTRHSLYVALAADANPGLAQAKAAMRTPVLVDGRDVFDARACQQAGFIYRGVGKG